jgi:hypothetical protein
MVPFAIVDNRQAALDEVRWSTQNERARLYLKRGDGGESRARRASSMWVFPRRKHRINVTGMVRDAAHT